MRATSMRATARPRARAPLCRSTIAIGVVLAVTVGVALSVPFPGTTVAAGAHRAPAPIDEQLLAAIDAAPTPGTRVAVEIVTADIVRTSIAVRSAGGTVTGSVPGQLVQASIPADRIDDLATATAPISELHRPHRIGRPERAAATSVGFGATTGEAVPIIHADAWQAAGLRGGVKIGIVDFFDLGLWNPVEQGPLPSTANGHAFCRDTTGMFPSACPMPMDGINNGNGDEHGVAVAEVVKDVAPDAELFIATVGTTSDLRDAVDWFAANGVGIITRSLGAPYDGPGDGTGPLDAVVDDAAERGITWFNSAGNDANGRYARFTGGVTADGYVDFDNGPGVDTALTITGDPCIGFAGLRWSTDWGKPAAEVTDYSIEISTPFSTTEVFGVGNQLAGEPPLELADMFTCRVSDLTVKVKRPLTDDRTPDVLELLLFAGRLEAGHAQATHSASGPVTDSRNPSLLAVGAVDPPGGGAIAVYSSRGPTNDGRVKPDISAPSCVASTVYTPSIYGAGACFNGTSAASPAAAGFAALLLGRGLALPGVTLAALVRHLVTDLGTPGPDDDFGAGLITLPSTPPPAAIDARPTQFTVLTAPQRILDTRAASPTAGAPIGPFAPRAIVDLVVPVDLIVSVGSPGSPVTAVAVSIVSVDSVEANYAQALPTLMGRIGGSANLNVAFPGQIKPNFAIVPVGAGGSISLYLPTGGNVVVDLMGTFSPAEASAVSNGRFVALTPERALDTRTTANGAKPAAGATIVVPTPTSVPADASAVVLNITATEADASGYLRVQPTGASGLATANGNYVAGTDSGTMSIAAFGADHTVSVETSASTHVVVDVLGYITGATSAPGRDGLFVPITPGRAYDSRTAPSGPHGAGSDRTISIAGPGASTGAIPLGASAISTNVAADAASAAGFLTAHPSEGPPPLVSNLNYPLGTPISNAGMVRLSTTGGLNVFVNQTTHVVIDVNGYFTGTT